MLQQSIVTKKSLLGHNDLKAVVYHERRVELGLEHDRFYDLVRWGDASTVFKTLIILVKHLEKLIL